MIQQVWWLLLLRGIFLILFGVLTVVWPGITLVTLAIIFAAYIFVSGVINIVQGLVGVKTYRYWFLALLLGLLEIAVGVYALAHPLISVGAFVTLIGFLFCARGIFEIAVAFDTVYGGAVRTYLAIAGILSLIAGVAVLAYPAAGGLAFTWVLGVYALIAGPILIASSILLQDITEKVLA